jgi:2-methylisocitrate lyase-like PEP mutase family enzyme
MPDRVLNPPDSTDYFRGLLGGTPLLFNGVEGGRTPSLALDRLRELGFRIVLFPLTALFAATRAVQEALAAIRAYPAPGGEGALSFSAFTDVVGMPAVQALEQRFAAR